MRSKTISLTNRNIQELIAGLLMAEQGESVSSFEQLAGGANSTVYKILTGKGNIYLAKKYLVRRGDNRDRLMTEYSGLTFLWNNGIKNIPEPICLDRDSKIGVYRFIDGRRLSVPEITERDINAAADFLGQIHGLAEREGAAEQPVASEACFSLQAYIDCVDGRLARLKNIAHNDAVHQAMRSFIASDYLPFYDEIKQLVRSEAEKQGLSLGQELGRRERNLSPSDFGFHNILRVKDGQLYFIDFEYFGWDDPLKVICDFYLQPEIPVPGKYRPLFLARINRYLGTDRTREERLPLVYLLLALKWCLIMLNAFLAERGGADLKILSVQLEKARGKLKETKREYQSRAFPVSLN